MMHFIIKRMLYMIPVMILISIIGFILIELPEGDYLSTLIYELQMRGDDASAARIERLKNRYKLDSPIYLRYWNWVSGWFYGDFGDSFAQNRPVSELIGDRLLLTVILSLSTMIFSYCVAIPIGIFSATHKYTIGDYFFTFIGFLGLSIPNFLLALVLVVVWAFIFNEPVGGLFSEQYAQAAWSMGKLIDLLKHLWIPVVVVGTAGTAGTIRIMRANMLDILGQQYIQTARSKGLKESVVIYKHALSMAINPIISRLGMSLPGIVSGATITAIVLNLPTVGPMLFNSLVSRDMYLAGTIIVMLAIFLQIGNLLADIVLAVIDPRIRYD